MHCYSTIDSKQAASLARGEGGRQRLRPPRASERTNEASERRVRSFAPSPSSTHRVPRRRQLRLLSATTTPTRTTTPTTTPTTTKAKPVRHSFRPRSGRSFVRSCGSGAPQQARAARARFRPLSHATRMGETGSGRRARSQSMPIRWSEGSRPTQHRNASTRWRQEAGRGHGRERARFNVRWEGRHAIRRSGKRAPRSPEEGRRRRRRRRRRRKMRRRGGVDGISFSEDKSRVSGVG